MKNLFFSELILEFFASEFGGYYDLQSISKINFIKLVIIMKKLMNEMGFVYLQHLLTGNIPNKIKKRRISSKHLEKVEKSSRYQRLIRQYSNTMESSDDDNFILKNIAILINTPMTLVDYERSHKLGADLKIEADLVSSEFLQFVDLI